MSREEGGCCLPEPSSEAVLSFPVGITVGVATSLPSCALQWDKRVPGGGNGHPMLTQLLAPRLQAVGARLASAQGGCH